MPSTIIPLRDPLSADMHYDVYGYQFAVQGTGGAGIEAIAKDFAFFRTNAVSDPLQVEIADEDPGWDAIPPTPASVYTPRSISFTEGSLTYIDYAGKGLATYDRAKRCFRIASRDPDLQYEAAYLFLISRIAEGLGRRRIHRVHALAVAHRGKAALFMLPMGGGKSTLGMHLLRHPEIQILSDDSPFIDPKGRVFAFPLRLGILPGLAHNIPERFIRTIQRMEFGPKLLVDSEYFLERTQRSADPGWLFVGRRSMSRECIIRPLSYADAMRSLMANCVVGLGLFQGMEYLFRAGPWGIFKQAGTGLSRLRCAHTLARRSRLYEIVLGRDLERNAETVCEFLMAENGRK